MMLLVFLILVLSSTSIQLSSATSYTCDPSSSCGCSEESTVITARIVGGEAAENKTWGWMVSLQQDDKHICGASLLTFEYAVTAAQCVDSMLSNQSELTILAGTNYLDDTSSSTTQRQAVTNIIVHPNYDPVRYTNDIAIIHFTPLIISSESKVAVICLPYDDQDPFQTDSDLVAIGWGSTDQNSYLFSDYLQEVTVQVLSTTSSDCSQSGLTNASVQFCAGVVGGGKDTCQGDSGGPLMAFVNNHWVLAGITSFGYGCAQAGYPGVYTRVSAFIAFIDLCIIPTTTSTTTHLIPVTSRPTTSNQPITDFNHGNIIDTSISIIMVCFSLWLLH